MDFEVLVLEGVFSADGVEWDPEVFSPKASNITVIRTGEPQLSLESELQKLRDHQIRITFHHLPPDPPEMEKWGVGSCLCLPMGWCPYNHHITPRLNFHYEGEGFLRKDGTDWYLEREGEKDELKFHLLVGHHARCAGVTVFDVAEMKKKILDSAKDQDMTTLHEQLAQAQNMMGNLKDILDKFK